MVPQRAQKRSSISNGPRHDEHFIGFPVSPQVCEPCEVSESMAVLLEARKKFLETYLNLSLW